VVRHQDRREQRRERELEHPAEHQPQRRRSEGGGVLGALRRQAWMPLVGLAAAASSFAFLERDAALWLSAIWAPLIASPLISALGASESFGRLLSVLGVFRVPTETDPP